MMKSIDPAVAALATMPECLHQNHQPSLLFEHHRPKVSVKHQETTFYSFKVPYAIERDVAQGTTEVVQIASYFDYDFTHESAKLKQLRLRNAHHDQYFNVESTGDGYREVVSYGIQEHTAVIPIYHVEHLLNTIWSTSSHISVQHYIAPATVDSVYDNVMTAQQRVEEGFLRSLGHRTLDGFLQSSPARLFWEQHGGRALLTVERQYQEIRDESAAKLQEYVYDIFPSIAEEVHRHNMLLRAELLRRLTHRIYGWYHPLRHGDLPLSWLLNMFPAVDEVADYARQELESSMREVG